MLQLRDKKSERSMQTAAQDSLLMFLENLLNTLPNGQEELQFKKATSVQEMLLAGVEMVLQVM